MTQDTLYYWVGYSWIPDPHNTQLAVNVIETTNGTAGLKKTSSPVLWDESSKNFLHSWSVKMDPATFPLAGLEKPTGISGLMGFHPSALSDSFGDGREWVEQQIAYDFIFEKNLSTILYTIIRKIYASHRSRQAEKKGTKTVVAIQGPIFSQALEKMDMFCSCDDFLVSFVTFFRRYLLPNPFLQSKTKDNMLLFGPDPSAHEVSLVKRYYLNTSSNRNRSVCYPIMIELPEGGSRFSDKESMRHELLKGLGIEVDKRQHSQALKRKTEWDWHPSANDLLKVYTPKFLLEANKTSQRRLTGEQDEVTNLEIMRVLKANVIDMSTRVTNDDQGGLADVARDPAEKTNQTNKAQPRESASLYEQLPENKRNEIERLNKEGGTPEQILSEVITALKANNENETIDDSVQSEPGTREPNQGTLL